MLPARRLQGWSTLRINLNKRERMKNAYLIAPVMLLTFLSACANGSPSCSKMTVSEQFLDELIKEVPQVAQCCPSTITVIEDWIVQNEP